MAGKCLQVLIDIGINLVALVLHHKPWMRQGFNVVEPLVLLIELLQVLQVFAFAYAKGHAALHRPAQLGIEALLRKGQHGFGQQAIVVVIHIFAIGYKAKRTD